MKATKLTLIALLIAAGNFTFAQTGQWKLTGNDLAGTEKLGSTNNQPLRFFTSNKPRMTLTAAGNLSIASDQSSIQFPIPGTAPKPMLFMFPSGSGNNARMVIAHSPAFSNFGLQYSDVTDRFDFLSAGKSIFNVNLGANSVGVNGDFNVQGISSFTGGLVGINTTNPQTLLHVARGSSGAVPNGSTTILADAANDNFISVLAPAASKTGILFGSGINNQDGAIVYNNPNTPRGLQFNTAGFTRMVITNTGSIGAGTTSPAADFHLVHSDGFGAAHGLKIQNIGPAKAAWTLQASSEDDDLNLYAQNEIIGFFDDLSGDYSSLSDARRKKDIEKAPAVLEKILQLDIKNYHFLQNKTGDKKHYGLIAQDVEKIFPEVVYHKTFDGGKHDLYAMNYSAFGVIALKAIQELEKQNAEKISAIDELKKRIEKLETMMNVRPGNSSQSSKNISIASAALEQNTPNPFTNTTTIRYTVPDKFSSAQIIVTDKSGNAVKQINLPAGRQGITGAGRGTVNVNASLLISGTYNYALLIDGKVVDSKQMILIK